MKNLLSDLSPSRVNHHRLDSIKKRGINTKTNPRAETIKFQQDPISILVREETEEMSKLFAIICILFCFANAVLAVTREEALNKLRFDAQRNDDRIRWNDNWAFGCDYDGRDMSKNSLDFFFS